MSITFKQDARGTYVLTPTGGIVWAVVGGPMNSEIVQLGAGGRVLVQATAAEKGYVLLADVFRQRYPAKGKDGRIIGDELYRIFCETTAQGQAGAFPDEKLPDEVIRRRREWAARTAVNTEASTELAALLAEAEAPAKADVRATK